MNKKTDWIQTYTGKKFYPLEPDAELICIEDIAHSLAMQCRYNGHSRRFYSVAQHSYILSREFFSGWQYRLTALLHDASEAYLSDIPRPLKRLPKFAYYREAERNLQVMIYDKFLCFDWRSIEGQISDLDYLMLAVECRSGVIFEELHPEFGLPTLHGDLKITIDPLEPTVAERQFLSEFYRIQTIQCEKTGDFNAAGT